MTFILYLLVVFPFSLMSLIHASFIVISLQDGPISPAGGYKLLILGSFRVYRTEILFSHVCFALRISCVFLQVLTSSCITGPLWANRGERNWREMPCSPRLAHKTPVMQAKTKVSVSQQVLDGTISHCNVEGVQGTKCKKATRLVKSRFGIHEMPENSVLIRLFQ